MSPVIAFDIAVVTQKVKVVIKDRCDLKKWGGWWWISSRSGWLLELLTELTKYLLTRVLRTIREVIGNIMLQIEVSHSM